jgi:2-methylaconitate cis-trans-isomerase PrpF
VATRIPGSIPNALARPLAEDAKQIRIAHASGIIVVDAKIDWDEESGQPHAAYAGVYRTARRLFDGRVHYCASR